MRLIEHQISEAEIGLVIQNFLPLFSRSAMDRDIERRGAETFNAWLRAFAISHIEYCSRQAESERARRATGSTPVAFWQRFKLQTKPATVYRLICQGSATPYNAHHGFTSRTRRHPIQLDRTIKQELEDHFNMRVPTPHDFVSVFGDFWHALAWGERWERQHPNGNCYIARIDTARVPAPMYAAAELRERLNLHIRKQEWLDCIDDEYLVLHRIPAAAIRDTTEITRPRARLDRAILGPPYLKSMTLASGRKMIYMNYGYVHGRPYGVETPERLLKDAETLHNKN